MYHILKYRTVPPPYTNRCRIASAASDGNSDCWELSVTYPECGTDEITEVRYENEKVFINDRQYFGNVSPVAWNLFIGGYQPARKWLKDRIGKKLTFSDIRHYQKIIFALCRTDALMRTELNIEKF